MNDELLNANLWIVGLVAVAFASVIVLVITLLVNKLFDVFWPDDWNK